jgi:hypothetical protein
VKLTRTHPLGRQVRQGLGTLLQAIGYPNMTLGYSG